MRILTFSTLFPYQANLVHGVFVAERLRHLQASGQVDSCVVAPIPWFFVAHPKLNPYVWQGKQALYREQMGGLDVWHPRYFLPPKVGMTLAPFLLAAGAVQTLRAVRQGGFDFDLIDAHYFYPDGVAALMLGQLFNKPVVITARGSDLNQIPQYRLPCAMIRYAARRAAGLITVSSALKAVLVDMGIASSRVTVLRNGVDLERFMPVDRPLVRQRLGMTRTTFLSVGHLIERKGHELIIRALLGLPDVDLWIIGDGPMRDELQKLAVDLGVVDRVRLIGVISQEQLSHYYAASDGLILASSREGWANVLLEAMACGTRVAATNVWGAPEVICAPEAGVLIGERTPEAIAQAIRQLMQTPADPMATRRYAEQFSWEATTQGQLQLFRRIIGS
ncbi:MAG: glycosyltransferase family 4 protein [Magnetococcales bacterium]|nr:glycosyltransferase family 4 protein [Magnetococcales bacterium]MBF0438064.1 glycosyltransferase family 4 protein [Magnetococcales bacterium]